MELLSDPQAWIAFATLTVLELVLGIDNIVFISILAGKLEAAQQAKARYLGLALALVMRVILLFSLTWVIGLTAPLFTVLGPADFRPRSRFDGRWLVSTWQGNT